MRFLNHIVQDKFAKISESQKMWQCFGMLLRTEDVLQQKIAEEENALIDALINVENLEYNEGYDKTHISFENLIKKLVMFVNFAVKFQEGEDNESIIIAVDWLCKLLERLEGKEYDNLVQILRKYHTTKIVLELICSQNLDKEIFYALLNLLISILGDGDSEIQTVIFNYFKTNLSSQNFFHKLHLIF